jgi:hypothetical protein
MRLRWLPTAPSLLHSPGRVLLVSTLATGCVFVDGEPPPETVVVTTDPMVYEEVVVIENAAPYILMADAGCYWEPAYRDELWYFEADVDDADSPFDVVAVYADVYDDFTGEWVDSFELFPTDDPYFWVSDWMGSSTWLDCHYGGYVVDFVAYDSFDAMDIVSVYPWTYSYY